MGGLARYLLLFVALFLGWGVLSPFLSPVLVARGASTSEVGLLLVSGLVQGSHAFYTGYAVLGWQAAGIAPGTIGLLWSLSVAAEVVVFFLLGRPLLARLGPGGTCALAGAAGLLRWSAMALDTSAWTMALVQPLHGLTFAAQHMAAMAVLVQVVPARLAATAQSLHASLGPGLATAALTLASGQLHGWFGPGGFWAMAALCAVALPLAPALGRGAAGAASR